VPYDKFFLSERSYSWESLIREPRGPAGFAVAGSSFGPLEFDPSNWKSMARMEVSRDGNGVESRPSRASVGRLSLYLRRLEDLEREGSGTVSSVQLGDAVGVTDAQVRKDLAHIGSLGQPGIGYPTHELITAIRRVLGLDREWSVAVVGIGNLSRALLRYRGFPQRGFRIVALFDTDASKVGQRLDGLAIHSLDELPEVLADCKAELGLVAVPAEAAQRVADALVAAGIRGLLNFAPAVLRLPANVSLVSVDLTVQLEQLAFLVQMSPD
jgi:redox-sensing transcriptional repressor